MNFMPPHFGRAMLKSIREAKLLTSWIDPNPAYETAIRNFIDAILDRNSSAEFLQDIERFQKRVALFGVVNSLAQLLLKATAPGVPEFLSRLRAVGFEFGRPGQSAAG